MQSVVALIDNNYPCWVQDEEQHSRVLGLEGEHELGQRVVEGNSQRSASQWNRGVEKHVLEMMLCLAYHEVLANVHYLVHCRSHCFELDFGSVGLVAVQYAAAEPVVVPA